MIEPSCLAFDSIAKGKAASFCLNQVYNKEGIKMSETITFADKGRQGEYERVLTATVSDAAVTLCFQDKSHGKNLQNIEESLKDAYQQRVKNWA